MKIAYTLKRTARITEDFESDRRIIEYIRKTASKKRRGKFIEQDLGTFPIPVKDFLYQTLKI